MRKKCFNDTLAVYLLIDTSVELPHDDILAPFERFLKVESEEKEELH